MHTDRTRIFFIFLSVSHQCLSPSICVHLWYSAVLPDEWKAPRANRLYVKQWRSAQMKWTKTDGRQARDTKYTLCGRPKGVQYQIRTTVDFSVPLAVSLFLLSHNCTAPFFHKQFTIAEPCSSVLSCTVYSPVISERISIYSFR